MPFTINLPIPVVSTGKIALVFTPDRDPSYAEVSQVTSPWILGTVFQVEEVWEVVTGINNVALVARFDDYPVQRQKRGNWHVLDNDSVPISGAENEGYIHYPILRVRKLSRWTVGIDSGGLPIKNGIDETDNCNFATREITIGFGGVNVQVGAPIENTSIFKNRKSAQPSRMRDFVIKRSAPRLGLFLFPGVELVSANYSMAIVNLAPVENELFDESNCAVLQNNCDAEFAQWRATTWPEDAIYPGNWADGQTNLTEGTHIFTTAAAAISTVGYVSAVQTYTCQDGGTRTYALANALPQ